MSETRIPTQKRSIEKRQRIIEKGFELMCEKGFYNTNTNEIADYAGVSTGIVYQYFNDKKEIFIEGVKNYSAKIMYPTLSVLETSKIDINNFKTLIETIIDNCLASHTISKKAHEELVAMQHLDQDVALVFKENEMNMTKKIVEMLRNNNILIEDEEEKIHVITSIVDNFCHEVIYHKHEELDYSKMKKYVIDLILYTLK